MISQKTVLGFLRCGSLPFWKFEKGDQRKNFARFFKICKYTFLIFEKEGKWKKCVSICKYTFFNIWKTG